MMKISNVKKVCVVTGSRAEYGLLKNLLVLISEDKKFKLQLIVTGSHLSRRFGNTIKNIKEDKFIITNKIDLQLIKDDVSSITKSMSLGITKFEKVLSKVKPDIILLLGDRYEIFSACIAATLCRIPIGHIHGGEITESSLDESFRHSISKMAHLHFTATEEYKKRVIQMGENPQNVYCVGGLGVDSIKATKIYSKSELEKKLKLKFLKKIVLVTFHPETLKKDIAKKTLKNLLESLKILKDTTIIFTLPNSDIDSAIINKLILKFIYKKKNFYSFKSLGQKKYYSCCKYANFIIGNSSSGILEIPSFKKFTINIGERQKGRIKAKSIIDCKPNYRDITKAIKFCLKKENYKKIKNVTNPYGKGGASKKIIVILKKKNFKNLIQKKFYDLMN